MNKDTDLEELLSKRKARLYQKVEQEISTIEGIIEQLLAGLNIADMAAKDRLILIERFILVHQRALSLEDTLEANVDENRDMLDIEFTMMRMRRDKTNENLRLIDTNATSHLDNEYGIQPHWR